MVDVNKIVQYRMVDGDLTPHNPSPYYSLRYVDINNYKKHIEDIREVSNLIIKQNPAWGGAGFFFFFI